VKPLLLSLILALAPCAFASSKTPDNLYQVEAIVFRPKNPTTKELVPDDVGEVNFRGAIDIEALAEELPASELGTEYQNLADNKWLLGSAEKSLVASGKYEVLAHVAWYQHLANQIKSIPIKLPKPLEIEGTDEPPLTDGIIQMKWLHNPIAKVDLIYNHGSKSSAKARRFRLQETARMKLNRLHYFDHPMFAVLLQVAKAQIVNEEE